MAQATDGRTPVRPGLVTVVTNEEALRERVVRAQNAKAGTPLPLSGTLTGGEIKEIKPDMPDEEYAALVARGEMQAVSPDGERRLRDKVRRIR